MRRLSVIGIGAGDPEYLTVQAIRALNEVDVFFFFEKGADREDLIRARREICARYIGHDRYRIVEADDHARNLEGSEYGDAIRGWRDQRQSLYERLIGTELADGQRGGFLVWGDPAFYDGTLGILQTLRASSAFELEVDVFPGISAIQALAARHKIALNQTGGSVQLTTGRRLANGWPEGVDDLVVLLDTSCAFRKFADGDTMIYWGAYLGTADEIVVSGTVAQRGEEIERLRSEARARKGWMFDTYLLRRTR